jgi:two-component system phosphate regulon sensor histidine kinase PhoR
MMAEDTSRLSRLVDDLLTLNELEHGAAPLTKDPLDLQTEIRKILERFKPMLESRGIAVENRIARCPSLTLSAHPDKFRQVLVNLLDNAIKFNRENGRIVLDAQPHPKGGIEVSVEDTGAGIPPEAKDRIFERFFRVDKARSRELGGTGLGLAIVKHIAEAHGGCVFCESVPGQGARFSVFFPS